MRTSKRSGVTGNCYSLNKIIAASLFIVTLTLITIKVFHLHTSDQCHASMTKTYQIVSDNKNRFMHHISQFKVSHLAQGLNLYVHTAFMDQRYNKTVLRIFGMEEKEGIKLEFKCKFVNNENNAVTETIAKRYWIDTSWPEWSPYFAIEYNCAAPEDHYNYPEVQFLSTGSNETEAKYQITLPIESPRQFRAQNRQDLAVCIRPLTGYHGTYRLVEWLETLVAAGYSHIIVYNSDITGPGRHILDYYQEKGIVSVINFPFLLSVIQSVEKPGRTDQERYALYQQIYLVAMHDCLYRYSNMYRYIAFHDLDQMILPPPRPGVGINGGSRETITDTIQRAELAHPDAAGFVFDIAWHWEEAGKVGGGSGDGLERLYMQQYAKYALSGGEGKDRPHKSIISTDRTITLNFNEILDVPRKDYKSIVLPFDDYGGVHSFSGKCTKKFGEASCKEMLGKVVLDDSVRGYRMTVSANFNQVLEHMQMT